MNFVKQNKQTAYTFVSSKSTVETGQFHLEPIMISFLWVIQYKCTSIHYLSMVCLTHLFFQEENETLNHIKRFL